MWYRLGFILNKQIKMNELESADEIKLFVNQTNLQVALSSVRLSVTAK